MTFPSPPEEIADGDHIRELVDVLEDVLTPRGFQRLRGLGWGVLEAERRLGDLVAGWDRHTEEASTQFTMNGITLFLDGRIAVGLDHEVSFVLYARPATAQRPGANLQAIGVGLGSFIDNVDARLDTVVLPHPND